MMIALALPIVAQYPGLFGEFVRVCHECTAVAEGAQILGWIEAESAPCSRRTRGHAFGSSEVSLCAILQEIDAGPVAEINPRSNVGHLPIKMYMQYGLGAR